MKPYTPPQKGDIVEAVEAAAERQAPAPAGDPLLGLIFGFGVRPGGRNRDGDRHIVGRRASSGLWTGQQDGAPGRLLDALNRAGGG